MLKVCLTYELSCISLPIRTKGKKALAAAGKFPSAIGKLIKTLATNEDEITNAMIGNDVLANFW